MPSVAEYASNPEPAQVQFIERTFQDLLGASLFSRGDGYREEILRWAHRRLFHDGASVETVRLELNGCLRQTRLIAVTSGKGGVGKTTFSVNLAIAFAQLGRRVLLLDADLGMANIHIFAGVNPPATLLDVIDRKASLADVLISGPAGIAMICGASGSGRLANLAAPVLDALGREVLRVAADYDVLVMDTGAGISASVLRFLSLAQDAIVIATPNLAAILDAYGVVKVAHEHRLAARMHVLVNQAEEESQGARVQERLAGCAKQFLQISTGNLGCLFHDPAVERSNQSRRPLLLAQPEHVNSRRIASIAAGFVNGRAESQPAQAPAAPGAAVLGSAAA